jgi:hypothetical protein
MNLGCGGIFSYDNSGASKAFYTIRHRNYSIVEPRGCFQVAYAIQDGTSEPDPADDGHAAMQRSLANRKCIVAN